MPHAKLDALCVFRAEVLPDIDGKAKREIAEQHHGEVLHVAADGERRDDVGAVAVDDARNDHHADGKKQALQSHLRTHAEYFKADGHIRAQGVALRHQIGVFTEHDEDADGGGDGLRADRCNGDTRNAHVETDDADEVEDNIQNGAQNEEIQRCFTVAECAQDRCRGVIRKTVRCRSRIQSEYTERTCR